MNVWGKLAEKIGVLAQAGSTVNIGEIRIESELTHQEYQNRQALLTKVKNFWIKGVLEQSLHEQILIKLGMEERPDAVKRPWNVMTGTVGRQVRELPPDTTILSVFDGIGVGRTLLILGEPGSGKTNSLLLLARDLIERAEQDIDQLLPVVLNLSSWSSPSRQRGRPVLQPIKDWLIEELNTKYDVPKIVATGWVQQQQLLFLLDGLDEVDLARRNNCVEALNAFQHEAGSEMVVCCRVRDYGNLSSRLRSQTAIYLKSLTPQQIQTYLNQLGTNLTGLSTLLRTDVALREMAQSPLLLNVMVFAYQGLSVNDLPRTLVVEERQKQLFDSYIHRILIGHRETPLKYPVKKFMTWLIWLAQQMMEYSQTVFLIETMQPSWLNLRAKRCYSAGIKLSVLLSVVLGVVLSVTLGVVLSGVLSRGVIVGVIVGLPVVLLVVLSVALGVGPNSLLLVKLRSNIQPVDQLFWSWHTAKRVLSSVLSGALLGGVIVGLLVLLLVGMFGGSFGGVIVGLFVGLFVVLLFGLGALFFALFCGLEEVTVQETITPNQGIWNSAKNCAFVWLLGVLLVVLSVVLNGVLNGVLSGLLLSVLLGVLLFGLDKGGFACIQHFTLRLVLWCNKRAPWNYAHFLDHATDRLFLQKVGGGYIFIHRLLMEHIAQLDPQTFNAEE